jgi:hypothetical protein
MKGQVLDVVSVAAGTPRSSEKRTSNLFDLKMKKSRPDSSRGMGGSIQEVEGSEFGVWV